MINRVNAWKCTDGSCHDNKQSAYNAEILHFYQTLPNIGNRQNTAIQFGKLVKDVDQWLEKAQLVLQQMNEETDTETRRSIAGQGG
jgi:hypothetical protein